MAVGPRQRTGSRILKAILKVAVPIVSLVATYYLTQKAFGTQLAQQFGDMGRQLVPLVVSMVVGAVARQLMK